MRIAGPVLLAVGLMLSGRLEAAKKPTKQPTPPETRAVVGQTTAELAAKSKAAVVMITTRGADGGPGGVGAGFFIATNGLIATSLHVIGEGRPVVVRLADGSAVPVLSIYAWDRHADLAVLKVGGTPTAVLPLRLEAEVSQGTEAVAMGHPLGLTQSVVDGVVSARREIDGVEMLQLAMPVEPGNSGGPLLDRQGRVLGIINSKAALTRNLGFATSVRLLGGLLEHPNGTTLERWLHYNSIDTNEWSTVLGADWHSHGGNIEVEAPGEGFGGRALLLRRTAPPVAPYEISVEVRLDDEAGAAGLAFDSDGAARHYGFYPTGGRIRTTAFGGPDVNSWRIMATTDCGAYKPGDWNLLRVRVLEDGFLGYVNEELVFAGHERVFGTGMVGLAKFRNTAASYRGFQVRPLKPADLADSTAPENATQLETAKSWLTVNTHATRAELLRRARDFERLAAEFRHAADRVHQGEVLTRLKEELAKPEPEIDLMNAALWLARYDQPALDVEMCQRRYGSLVNEAKTQVNAADTASQKVEKIRRFLFEEAGFHGSRFDYYNLANCHVNSVLDEREGIPVTLAVLYLDLCGKLGVNEVAGLPVPGHFMVRFRASDTEAWVIDVYDQGRKLTFDEADKVIAGDSDLEPHSASVKTATKREMLLRIVTNLRQFTQQQRGLRETLPYVDLMVELAGDGRAGVANRLDRVGLLLELGEKSRAKSDLQWILDRRPDGVDVERLEEALRRIDERE